MALKLVNGQYVDTTALAPNQFSSPQPVNTGLVSGGQPYTMPAIDYSPYGTVTAPKAVPVVKPTIKSTAPAPAPVGAPIIPPIVGTTPTQPTAPLGSVASLSGFNPSGYSKKEQGYLDAENKRMETDMNATFDPKAVYKQNLSMFQAQIDAYNNIYNDQLNQSRIQNAPEFQSRVGSQTAMAARGGLLGSDPGKAMVDNQVNDNNKVQASQDAVFRAERDDKIARIFGKITDNVTQAKKDFESKKAKSTEDFIAGIKARPEERKKQTTTLAKALLAEGVDIEDLSSDELEEFATKIGVDSSSIKSEYKAQQSKVEADSYKELPAMAKEYEYAKQEGYKGTFTQYQNEDANRKQIAARVAKDPSISENEASAVSKLSSGLVPGQLIPNSGGVPFIDNNGFLTVDGFNAAIRAAQQDNLPRAKFLKEFGSYLAPSLLSSYGVTPKEIKDISGELPVTEE